MNQQTTMKRFLSTLVLSLLITVLAALARAQEAPVHGFVQANYGLRLSETGKAGPKTDFLLGDSRLQLELSRFSASGNAAMSVKVDLFNDAVDGQTGLDLREAYVNLSSRYFDLRAGRQIITWGVGDLVFISDVFTKDWTALLAGRPLQYLKIGSDAVNVNLYTTLLAAQIILAPFFEPDLLPQGRRLLAFDPFPGLPRVVEKPQRSVANTELALRLYRYIGAFDLAAYVYRGFWRSPPGMRFENQHLTLFYPKLAVYGASLQGGFLNGVLSLEGGIYDSRSDRQGMDPTVENSQTRFLVGYQRAFGDNLTVGVQYYGEWMSDYQAYRRSLPDRFPMRKEVRHSATLRLTRFFKYQTLRLSLFVWASPNEEDYYLNPELHYSVSDELWVALGGNFFGGTRDYTFLGQFEHNDNLYMTIRYGF